MDVFFFRAYVSLFQADPEPQKQVDAVGKQNTLYSSSLRNTEKRRIVSVCIQNIGGISHDPPVKRW